MESKIEFVLPAEIEKRSFEIIEQELLSGGIVINEDEKPVTKRVIHTTADFDYASTLMFSENAVEKAKNLILGGAHIVTDTNMAKAGINKIRLQEFGGEVHCFMADEDVAAEAKARNVTRATVSMERASRLGQKVIFALGNAPTAMISLYEMIKGGKYVPDFVIGVPVGFVNVVQAKELFLNMAQELKISVPYIINKGRKGGSNVAAAICNALIYDLKK